MNSIELVKEYFPEASEEEANGILWSRTGFPGFFKGDETIEEQIRKQLSAYKKLIDEDKEVCDLCNSEATINGLCSNCDKAIKEARNENSRI